MEPPSETEQAIADLAEAQSRFAAMAERIEQLKAQGASTEIYQQLLRTLETTMQTIQAKVRQLTGSLVSYRCYLMSGEHIRAVKVVDAPDDATVLIKVGHFLKEHPEYPTIEVWQGQRFIARLTKSQYTVSASLTAARSFTCDPPLSSPVHRTSDI